MAIANVMYLLACKCKESSANMQEEVVFRSQVA